MTDDDLVRRLLVGACAQNDVAWSLMRAAADRIKALTAEHNATLARLAGAVAREIALTAERDRLREALEHIAQWSEAYPTEVFPEPDFAQAASALSSSGMSIDVVSASNMRHATKGVGKIARAALKGESNE